MNIGLFNDNFPPINDGVALTVKNYADQLYAKGQNPVVVTAKSPKESYDLPYTVLPYTSIPIPQRKPYRFGVPQLDRSILHTLNRTPMDIIHAHCPFTTGQLGMNQARKRHIPLVTTFHSKYRDDFERALHSRTLANGVVKYIVHFYNHADEVWVSQQSVVDVIREYGFQGRVEVVDLGIDLVTPKADIAPLRQARRKALGIADDVPMFLFVGQHIWEKNIGFILDALAHLPAEMPFKLVTLGTGYAATAFARKAEMLGLKNRLMMQGAVEDREVLKSYYAAADLLLFPSPYDTMGLVVREAAALHTPSIMLRDTTGSAMITEGYNGLLTNDDPLYFARLIRHAVGNPDTLTRIGDNAACSLARSWDEAVEEVIGRYTQLIQHYNAH